MGKLTRGLTQIAIIGLDTSVFIYHFESHPIYHALTQEILQGVEAKRWEAVTSVITLMEISVRPFQLGQVNVARKYEALLASFPNLRIVDIDRNIARKAAQLRAGQRIRPADAIQVAACLNDGAGGFITNDRRLAKLSPILPVFILDDFIETGSH